MNTIPVGLSSENHQCEHIRELLADAHVSSFVYKLITELKPLKTCKSDLNENKIVEFIIDYIAEDTTSSVQNILYAISRALHKLSSHSLSPEHWRKTETIACALYCLAACKWVNLSIFNTDIHEHEKCKFISKIPNPAEYKAPDTHESKASTEYLINIKIICAVIATKIYGGKIEFAPSTSKTNPLEPKHYHPIKPDNTGDCIIASIEAAFFKAVMGQTEASVINAVKAKPLEPQERTRLKARLNSLQNIERIIPTLIILDPTSQPVSFVQFADDYCTPVMLPTPHDTARILEVSPDVFAAQFEELWRYLPSLNETKQPHSPTNHTGENPMSNKTGDIHLKNINGPVNINTGSHASITQTTGSIESLQQNYSQSDAQELKKLFEEVRLQIANLPGITDAGKADLDTKANQAESEVAKKDGANKKTIKTALDSIETMAKVLTGGTQLLNACEALGSKIALLIGNYF